MTKKQPMTAGLPKDVKITSKDAACQKATCLQRITRLGEYFLGVCRAHAYPLDHQTIIAAADMC